MALVGVVIDEMFDDIEYTETAKAFKEAGHSLLHIGLKSDQLVKGKRHTMQVKIDENISEVDYNKLDAIFIPGGYSPDHLRGYKSSIKFIKNFFNTGKPIFAICHAPQLLITAQVIKGRKVTGWKSIVQDIINAGAEYVNEEVVEDGNLISSRGPSDINAFIKASLKKLEQI